MPSSTHKRLRLFTYAAAAACAVTLLVTKYKQRQAEENGPVTTIMTHESQPAGAIADHGPISDFSLTERDGSAVTKQTLEGSVWLVDFIFTSCRGPCPLMSGHMKTLQAHFKDQPNVRFLSISTDPSTDTPEVLRAYAERFEADSKRWLFLTGDKQQIISLAGNAFKLPAGEKPDMHSSRFALLDRKGHVRAWFDSIDPDFQERIRTAATTLANEPSA